MDPPVYQGEVKVDLQALLVPLVPEDFPDQWVNPELMDSTEHPAHKDQLDPKEALGFKVCQDPKDCLEKRVKRAKLGSPGSQGPLVFVATEVVRERLVR